MTGLYERLLAFKLDERGREAGMRLSYAELLCAGVTSVVDLSAPFGDWFGVMRAAGLRVWCGPVFASARWVLEAPQRMRWDFDAGMGRTGFARAQEVMAEAERDPSGRLTGIVFPAQIETVDEDLLRESIAFAESTGRPFTTHIAQSVVEVREIVSRHGETVITRNSYGALCLNTPNALFADVDYALTASCSLGRCPRNTSIIFSGCKSVSSATRILLVPICPKGSSMALLARWSHCLHEFPIAPRFRGSKIACVACGATGGCVGGEAGRDRTSGGAHASPRHCATGQSRRHHLRLVAGCGPQPRRVLPLRPPPPLELRCQRTTQPPLAPRRAPMRRSGAAGSGARRVNLASSATTCDPPMRLCHRTSTCTGELLAHRSAAGERCGGPRWLRASGFVFRECAAAALARTACAHVAAHPLPTRASVHLAQAPGDGGFDLRGCEQRGRAACRRRRWCRCRCCA